MIVTTVKFMVHDNFACKRGYGCGYLLGGKRQAYFVGKTSNLPLTYLPIKPFNLALQLLSRFSTMNRRSDRRTGSVVMKLSPSWSRRCSVALNDERTERNFSPELSLEFGRESNFDELVMEAYG